MFTINKKYLHILISRLDSCEAIKAEVNNNTDSQINSSEFLSLKTLLPPCLPEPGSELEVRVSYAVSPDNFVILAQTGGDEGEYRADWCLVLL